MLREADRPKSLAEKVSEYLAKPPQPILRFYGDFRAEEANGRRHLLFAVRNGLPLPLLYGIYARAAYNSFADYIEKTDHIGPFGTDDWRLTLENARPAMIDLSIGLVPMEILTDRAQVTVGGGL